MVVYIVFVGDTFYPRKGFEDCRGVFSQLNDAMTAVANSKGDWWHVYELDSFTEKYHLVKSGERSA